MKLISICIPVYNEEENVVNTYETIKNLFEKKLINFDYEIIFTDNHSEDKTESVIMELCSKNKKVKKVDQRHDS